MRDNQSVAVKTLVSVLTSPRMSAVIFHIEIILDS